MQMWFRCFQGQESSGYGGGESTCGGSGMAWLPGSSGGSLHMPMTPMDNVRRKGIGSLRC